MFTHNLIAAFVLSALSMTTSAQDNAPPASAPPASEPLLSGPTVEESTPRTLVQRDFGGALEKLEIRPEQAALALLSLSDEQRQTVDRALAERSAAVTKLTFDHLDLFLTIQSARQSGMQPGLQRGATRAGDANAAAGDPAPAREVAAKMRELRRFAGPLVDPPLAEQIATRLPQEASTEFQRLVREYTAALAVDNAAMNPEANPAAGVERRMEFNLLLREMARALAAVVAERREQTEQLLISVSATPEQEQEIRHIIREAAEQSRDANKPAAREELMRRIMQALTPEQRRTLIESRRPQPPPPATVP